MPGRADDPGAEPRGGAFRMPQRRGLLPAGGQRFARSCLCPSGVAERDEQREAMQSRTVQVAKRCLERGISLPLNGQGRSCRGTPPSRNRRVIPYDKGVYGLPATTVGWARTAPVGLTTWLEWSYAS
jgi:hypothetical protein